MRARLAAACLLASVACAPVPADEPPAWWNAQWTMRTTIQRPSPDRGRAPRPVEAAVDFPRLLREAGLPGTVDPASLRVVERDANGRPCEVPSAWRTEFDAERGIERGYATWFAQPQPGQVSAAELYFDVADRGLKPARYDADQVPPENLLANPGFEDTADGSPAVWKIEPESLVRLARFRHTTGRQSLQVVVDESTPATVRREVVLSQRVDVHAFAGEEMVFECDLLAEQADYGAPVAITIEQYRDDGSRIPEDAVEPRWLDIELAPGQLVQFRERGRFSPQAAAVNVVVRMRCSVRDADTGNTVTGPDTCFTIWLDRLVLRPGERWPWPGATHGGFQPGALADAPVNRGMEFTGLRRVAFNGASEATLSNGLDDPDPRSVHWGLAAGTLEFWCRPSWDAEDDRERVFFDAVAYGHRLQSRLRKLGGDGGNRLEFTIADAGGTLRSVRAFAPFRAGAWHHLAATWDFPRAQLALFFDGEPIGATGPDEAPWPSSLVSQAATRGIGIAEDDSRSMPMQAFLGGDAGCRPDGAAEAVLDEVRISDCARYHGAFVPVREEFAVDGHTRGLWHFENDWHGVHDGDDGFVRGHLACELPRWQEAVPLDVLVEGKVDRRLVVVQPNPPESVLATNRSTNQLTVTRPFEDLPDPRRVEYRTRQVERLISSCEETFTVPVAGEWEPLMDSLAFELADPAAQTEIIIPHWRANDNVVPLSVASLAETLAPGVEDEAQRALEVFRYALATTNYFDAHYCETLPARHRPRVSYTLIKALNIYPFDQCGPLNHTLRKLFLTRGISSQNASGTHHQFQQAFYQGSWRMFDLSPRVYWLNRDNTTVASRRAFEEDLYLKLREGSSVRSALRGRRYRPSLGTAERPHSMDFPLRPDERVSLGWQNEGRWFELTGNRQPIPLGKIPPFFGNGSILYQPRHENGAAATDNLDLTAADGRGATLRARQPQRPASLVYRLLCPYILSDAQVRGGWSADRPGAVRASLSFDEGRTWTEVWCSPTAAGELAIDLREHIAARYAYWLRLELEPGAGASLAGLAVRTTFVVSPLSLPGTLALGENRISLVGGPVQAPVKTVCRWIERHRTDLAIGIDSISYYLNGDQSHRHLLVVPPGGSRRIAVTVEGRPCRATLSVEGLPAGWVASPPEQPVELAPGAPPFRAGIALRPHGARVGEIRTLELVLREAGAVRRVAFTVLVAPAALACEAEKAESIEGADVKDSAADSGGQVVAFRADGRLEFPLRPMEKGSHALWLRARWEEQSSTRLELAVDGGKPRALTAAAMIGFTDWNDPRRAHTKMFAHFGEAYGHWAWYRIGDVEVGEGSHRLSLTAQKGAILDALLLLPQTDQCDRAAMNLLQNWNYRGDAAGEGRASEGTD